MHFIMKCNMMLQVFSLRVLFGLHVQRISFCVEGVRGAPLHVRVGPGRRKCRWHGPDVLIAYALD
jgi:hypothetical protein